MRDYLGQHHGDKFDNTFGKGTGKAIMHATAGRFVTPVPLNLGWELTGFAGQFDRNRGDRPPPTRCAQD